MAWFEETLHQNYRQLIEGELIYGNSSGLQDVRVYHNRVLGNFLTIDGVVQLTEGDEFIYHEMMTHPILLSIPEPKELLVIGGGDGGVLRECLKYPSVEKIDFVEIDASIIDLSKKFFPKVNAGSFDNPKVNTIIGDGAKFVAETKNKYDAILIDSSDPLGPSAVLFQEEFYKNVKKCLKENAAFIRQTGSSFFQKEEIIQQKKLIEKLYQKTFLQVASIPTYIGGFFTFIIGTNQLDIQSVPVAKLAEKYTKLDCKYYNPDIHFAAFCLPDYLKNE